MAEPAHCYIYVIAIVIDKQAKNSKIRKGHCPAPHINVHDNQHAQHGHARWTDNFSSPILTGLDLTMPAQWQKD